MRLFVVASLLLFVSMATAMGSLLVVDAESAPVCNPRRCERACKRIGLWGCCRSVSGPECYCRRTPGCPRLDWPLVINDVKDEVCNSDRCAEHCKSKGQYGCCAGYPGRCECRDAPICPLAINDVKDEVCDSDHCAEHCKSKGQYGCCAGYPGRCECRDTPICPLVINDVKDEVCDSDRCVEHCKSKEQYGCCAGYPGRCECRDAPICPYYVTMEITKNEDVAVKKSIA